MVRERFIALKLRDTEPKLAAALRPVLDRSLALLGRVLSTGEDDEDRKEIVAKLEEFRTSVGTATTADAITTMSESCFALCEAAISQGQNEQTDRRTELARLVALVRDTVSMLSGDGDSFSSDIEKAAGRFNALLRIGDVNQLKHRLMSEVGELQKIAADRQQQWKETVAMFETRVETLETELVISKQEASVDPLTGVGNRREFEESFRGAMLGPNRQFVVAVFDLDDFKKINDTGGHAAGDDVLRNVAQTLKTSVRATDIVARIGGDEFAMIGHGATLREAQHRLGSVVATLAAIPTGLDAPAHVTVSCGVAEFSAGDTMESLMERADSALYEAKRTDFI
jgi:diguanylate cyclase